MVKNPRIVDVLVQEYTPIVRYRETWDSVVEQTRNDLGQHSNKFGSITQPILILWGESDPAFPIAHAKRFAKDIPNAILEPVSGAGHFPHRERPELATQSIMNFVLARDAELRQRHGLAGR